MRSLFIAFSVIVYTIISFWVYDKIVDRRNHTDETVSSIVEEFEGKQPVNIPNEEASCIEVINFRHELRHMAEIDSIYMTIPDIALYDILINHGSGLDNQEVVDIYKSNKDMYDKMDQGLQYDKVINANVDSINETLTTD